VIFAAPVSLTVVVRLFLWPFAAASDMKIVQIALFQNQLETKYDEKYLIGSFDHCPICIL
jgi:hypothetical protein